MKKPPPSIDLGPEDMPDLQTLTPAELNLVPFEKMFWMCGVDHCTCYSGVRDYGIGNLFYWPRRSGSPWINCRLRVMICYKHWVKYRRFFDNIERTDVAKPKYYYTVMPVTRERLRELIKENKIKSNDS